MTTTTSSLPFESIRRRNTSVQVETSVVHLSNGTRPQNPVAPPPTNVLAAEDSTGVTSAFDDDDVDIEAQIESHSFNNCSELKNISA